ncbi:MAG: phosphatidylglycerophosphatase A [Candidatus Wallbacteria bacterium HGW-Wallbacteria-1]|jgi:phosphatidylglycerophosphatase A|uniref:Phosphatidylglycerophosphatase A n=1 Tax=Candidatus Wallbacteria bacterium HGW-Wallbacteria-1 TaxID=2013854 RepID=A0A2N1PTR5_9BACT|nr:MAG: phosphatidylglycerophosphatase A [Candidatus Wallbacteria bacterium HGW-Wallbacteria-1]
MTGEKLPFQELSLVRRLAGGEASKASLSAGVSELIATGLYSGYSPFAPGTAGSVAALLFWPLLRRLSLKTYVVFVALLYWAGIITGENIEKALGKRDPGRVVIDEFVGMYITLAGDPGASWTDVFLALVYFRFFDIIKPWPANRFNAGDGGFAIMTDDVVAGLYALVIYRLTRKYFSGLIIGLLAFLPGYLARRIGFLTVRR